MADKKKMTVAEMLAAARKADGKGSDAPKAEQPAEQPDEQQAEPIAAAPEKPAAASPKLKPGEKPSVADILAMARSGDAKGAAKPAAAEEKPKAAAAPAEKKPAAKTAAKAKPAASAPAERMTTASILAAAAARLRELRRELPGSPLLLQEFLGGAEYSVGLVGNPGAGFVDLPIHEVDYRGLDPELPPILSFAFKNDPGSRYGSQVSYRPARLAPADAAELRARSRRLFARLGCRDYARIDYRADAAGSVKLLEVNPNPAITWKSSLQLMAATGGYDYPGFLGLLLAAGLRRSEEYAAPHA